MELVVLFLAVLASLAGSVVGVVLLTIFDNWKLITKIRGKHSGKSDLQRH